MSYKFQTGPAELSGAVAPAVDGAFDLGASGLEWKDLYIDGTANIDSLVADTADINGGNIDGTVIGATSVAAGSFAAVVGTTGTYSGVLKTDDTTEATSTTDGSLQTDGGLSVAKSAVIGDDLDLLSDGAIINIGSTSKFTLTDQAANNCVMAASGARLAFGNAGEYISGDGTDLDIVSSGDVDITATLVEVIGSLGVQGNVDLGNAATDSVTVTGRFDSDLLPIADSTSDLGSSALQWAEVHADVGHIDAMTVTGASTLGVVTATTISGSSTLQAGGATTLQALTAEGASDLQGAITLSGAGDTALDVSADSFYFRDADGTLKRDTMADYAAALVASEPGFASSGGKLQFDPQSLSAAAVQTLDEFVFADVNDSDIPKKVTIDDMATLFAGDGLSATTAVMALDLNELTAAAVDVATDSIAIVDANDSNASRKESIADLVAGMAGTGLSASSGQLSVSAASAPAAVGDANATLTEAFNYASAEITAARTWTLPASAGLSVGDTVYIKAAAIGASGVIIVARAGSQTIDGLTELRITEAYASISLKYVAADTWRIF